MNYKKIDVLRIDVGGGYYVLIVPAPCNVAPDKLDFLLFDADGYACFMFGIPAGAFDNDPARLADLAKQNAPEHIALYLQEVEYWE